MWKLVIADDERVIVKGLKKMIHWEALGIEVVGEAYNGEQLKKSIEFFEPDIVLTDIMMPYVTGLEILHWHREQKGKAKFVFVSGYQEFSYAQEALKNGAVDYLLKPVSAKDLEEALKKAIRILREQNMVEIFDTEKDEFQKLFENINNGRNYENEDLYRMFREAQIDITDCFYVGICAGICPDTAARMSKESFGQFNLTRFSVFNRLTAAFGTRKLGFVVKKDEDALHIMGVFPGKDREIFIPKYVEPIRKQVEIECAADICIGIGQPGDRPAEMLQSYKDAKFAFGMYHFAEERVIDFRDIHWEYRVSFEDYKESVEQAFRGIISRDEQALEKLDRVMDNVEAIHYGNWNAVVMRTMHFTGDLGSKLNQYKLLDIDFYKMQDELQRKVESQFTMSALKKCIHNHYADLLNRIYEKGKSEEKVLIEDVKNYIRQHYTEDLSIKELAEVACVSQNYFSAMFKKETGQNYKAYLTSIRMEEALRLLRETDDKTYEIAERVGYNNVRRFVDAFKQIYSVSPMEYRKGLRGE
ncbi:MAG: response regulator [Lachnospiraceae bacterium]|nr:response regulator [Lachnospiraceae bacterium]